MKVLAVIPARSGSKSVPHKNIREIGGKPMIAHSIQHALDSKYINRVIVSTDSEEYASIARKYGAETPFLRPEEYATDSALDLDVFQHALSWLKKEEGYEPDIVVQLRPTYPIRNVSDIDAMIEICMKDANIDSVRSLSLATEVPYKMWVDYPNGVTRNQEEIVVNSGRIAPLISDYPECYNMPRQELPVVYYQNACIDVFRPRVITEKKSMSGDVIVGYKMKENFDIDTEEEFQKAKEYLEQSVNN